MNKLNIKEVVENLIDTFFHAGKISLDLRNNGLTKKIKSDNTPVSNGDIEVNKIITNKLKQLTPHIPIVSEETSDNKLIENLKDFWLVDPIDGTYDYINDLEEFTINAGLIIDKTPVAGLIFAPAKNRLFYSCSSGQSFEIVDDKLVRLTGEKRSDFEGIKAVSYSNELKPVISEFHKKFGVKKFVKMKSSLKFCVVAAGEYDLYVTEPRASEWDIAAGHAILKNAGGTITDFEGNEITYGKKNFKNPSIILKRTKNL